jgi:pilus assembly protein Flp/PilA
MTDLWSDERGATAAEYALMVGLVAAVIVGAVAALGVAARATFRSESLAEALR